MFPSGYLLSERYEIVNSIGEGGMANVYLAYDTILQRKVAIKVLRGDLSGDELFVKRFRREALASTSLNHPNVVQIYDVGDENGKYYIVMEYVEGITLKQLLLKRKRLTVSEVVDISKQIVKGIDHAHSKHIVHRDIKPHNILVQRDGTIKITDFGIAVTLNDTILTQTNSILGSVHYLPPEQINGNIADTKSDIYSIGVLLYELLTGELPFNGDSAVTIALMHVKNKFPSVREVDPSIPQSLDNIIIRATAKNPKNRFVSAEEMLSELRNFDKNSQTSKLVLDNSMEEKTINMLLNNSEDVDYVEPIKKPKNGKKLGIIIGLIAVLVAIISLVIYIVSKPDLVTMPDVVGMNRGEATQKLVDSGFAVSSDVNFEEHDVFKIDQVISTSEKVGTEKPRGFTVVLTVSTGPAKYTMEDFVGKNVEETKKILQDKGMVVSVKEKEHPEITDRTIVIEQAPVVGTEIAKGQVVTLYIVKEKEMYPDLVSLKYTKEQADSFCRQYTVSCFVDYEYSDTVPTGIVISQSQAPNTEIIAGQQLNIVISSGPKPVVEPPVTDPDTDPDTETDPESENNTTGTTNE